MGKRQDNPLPGLVVVDKPSGPTSHDVVARVRRLAATRKVGHAGTLDPMATGVLVLGVGKATKLLTWVTGHSKTYEATIRLGVATTTDDAEGEVLNARGCPELPPQRLEEAIGRLRGDILQVPSTVSAIKVDGKRAYALAREGADVVLEARPVSIHRFDVLAAPRILDLDVEDGGQNRRIRAVDVDVVVDCSSGTYIRALARDLGEDLGCGAHLTALRRTRVGDFGLGDALTLDQLEHRSLPPLERGAEPAPEHVGVSRIPLIPLGEAATAMFPALHLTADEASRFAHGQAPRRTREQIDAARADRPDATRFAVIAPDGAVMGIVEAQGQRVKTLLVFEGGR